MAGSPPPLCHHYSHSAAPPPPNTHTHSPCLPQRPDLVSEAISAGLAEALLQVLLVHKVEATCCAAVSCLAELSEDRDSWAHIVATGEAWGTHERVTGLDHMRA